MFEICEFCKVSSGDRQKLLPTGNVASKSIVILPLSYKGEDSTFWQYFKEVFGDAYVVFRRACVNVEAETGNLCCGILIRNILHNYQILVMPSNMTKEFLGVEINDGLVQYKTGQLVVAYSGLVTSIGVQREYERALKQ